MPNRQWLLPVASSASSGGGGGVSSVSGTANQINSTGGTTPVLSISSTFVFPGSATATTQPAGDNSTKIATTAYADNIGLLKASVSLTPTQIKNMKQSFATAVQIIAAPGAGNIIDIVHISTNLQFVTTPYATGSGAFQLSFTDGASLFSLVATFFSSAGITATNSQFQSISTGNLINAANTLNTNQPVIVNLTNNTSYTAGDSPIAITVSYRIVAAA